jgi:hypothetical protein
MTGCKDTDDDEDEGGPAVRREHDTGLGADGEA